MRRVLGNGLDLNAKLAHDVELLLFVELILIVLFDGAVYYHEELVHLGLVHAIALVFFSFGALALSLCYDGFEAIHEEFGSLLVLVLDAAFEACLEVAVDYGEEQVHD